MRREIRHRHGINIERGRRGSVVPNHSNLHCSSNILRVQKSPCWYESHLWAKQRSIKSCIIILIYLTPHWSFHWVSSHVENKSYVKIGYLWCAKNFSQEIETFLFSYNISISIRNSSVELVTRISLSNRDIIFFPSDTFLLIQIYVFKTIPESKC